MSLEELVSRYVNSADKAFDMMDIGLASINIDEKGIRKIVDYARCYLEDAKYYRENGKLAVSLTSVAYCEGLLDALRMLGAVKFEWPARQPRKER